MDGLGEYFDFTDGNDNINFKITRMPYLLHHEASTIEMIAVLCKEEDPDTCQGTYELHRGLEITINGRVISIATRLEANEPDVTLSCSLNPTEIHYYVFQVNGKSGEWKMSVDGTMCDSKTGVIFLPKTEVEDDFIKLGSPGLRLFYFKISTREREAEEVDPDLNPVCKSIIDLKNVTLYKIYIGCLMLKQ